MWCPGRNFSEISLKSQFSHLFDFVCGTSTGGLIALSQLKTPRKELKDMLDLYLGLGRDVFRYHIGGKSPIMGTVHKLSGYFLILLIFSKISVGGITIQICMSQGSKMSLGICHCIIPHMIPK